MKKTKIAYMCQTDFNWELGEAYDEVQLYPTVASLKFKRLCVEHCGIVKVKVTLDRVVKKSKNEWVKKNKKDKRRGDV